jgi:hypothetical protein
MIIANIICLITTCFGFFIMNTVTYNLSEETTLEWLVKTKIRRIIFIILIITPIPFLCMGTFRFFKVLKRLWNWIENGDQDGN